MARSKIGKLFSYARISIFWFLVCFYFKNLVLWLLRVGVSFRNDVLELYVLKNTGSAFSLFKDSNFTLAIIAAVVIAGIIVCILKNSKKLNWLDIRALGFLTAGIASNMLERFVDGYVTDYIKLTFIDFPVFNLADVFINIGAVLFIASVLLIRRGKCD